MVKVIKQYSHKTGLELMVQKHSTLLDEVIASIESIKAVDCLTKISSEKSKIRQFGGLVFSPPTINHHFKTHLYPLGWAQWDANKQKYIQPRLQLSTDTEIKASRFRELDGLKDRVGLEIQFGKYAFMGYDIFSKMVIFKNKGLIDYGIEIVAVQEMVKHMSTGVSSFEALMIDFEHRGEADIDVPTLVLGIGLDHEEWEQVRVLQQLFKDNPTEAKKLYPIIGQRDQGGTKPGPK